MLYSVRRLRLWMALCLLGLCVVLSAGSASPAGAFPIILHASVSPSALPAVGGTVTLSVTPEDPNGASQVGMSVSIYLGDADIHDLGLGTVSTGSIATAGLGFPANTGPTAQVYTVKVSGSDAAGITAEQDFTVTVAGAKPIELNATVSPSAIPAVGGVVSISIAPQDPNGAGSIYGAYYEVDYPNGYAAYGSLYDDKTGSSSIPNGDTATNTFSFPANGSATAQVYTVKVYGSDAASTTEQDLTVTVASPQPLVLTATVAPLVVPAAGSITVKASATSGAAILDIFYDVYDSAGTNVGHVDMGAAGGSSVFPLPVNGGYTTLTYRVIVSAVDAASRTTSQTFPISQGAVLPITLTVKVNPTYFPTDGGIVDVTATAVDPNGISPTGFTATLLDDTGKPIGSPQTLSNGYAPLIVPANTGNNYNHYTVRVTVTDGLTTASKDILISQGYDVTPDIGLKISKTISLPQAKSYSQNVVAANTTKATIKGPIIITLTGLPSSVTVTNAAGQTPSGQPFLLLTSVSLAPGQTASVPIIFKAPSAAAITYSIRVSGSP